MHANIFRSGDKGIVNSAYDVSNKKLQRVCTFKADEVNMFQKNQNIWNWVQIKVHNKWKTIF